MEFKIKRSALKCLLNCLLSCRCPISDNIEEELIDFYKSSEGEYEVNYESVVAIAEKEGRETVFHRLREFCTYSIDNFSNLPVISVNDVLRHFCTIFHWHLVENALPKSYKQLIDIQTWFVSHMLLPVELTMNDGKVQGTFTDFDGCLILRNIFLPPDIPLSEGSVYCVHFASVIAEVSRHQFDLLNSHLDDIEEFKIFRKQISEIDYLHFQQFGDYQSICRERYTKYF